MYTCRSSTLSWFHCCCFCCIVVVVVIVGGGEGGRGEEGWVHGGGKWLSVGQVPHQGSCGAKITISGVTSRTEGVILGTCQMTASPSPSPPLPPPFATSCLTPPSSPHHLLPNAHSFPFRLHTSPQFRALCLCLRIPDLAFCIPFAFLIYIYSFHFHPHSFKLIHISSLPSPTLFPHLPRVSPLTDAPPKSRCFIMANWQPTFRVSMSRRLWQ